MTLVLLPNKQENNALGKHYKRAFETAVELYVVSAYLTDWNPPAHLNSGCERFRMIIGSDFGITKKHACRSVIKWLPANRKQDFLVADSIQGFHPKAIFWREKNGSHHALVGSSNLTKAAFSKNHEANAYMELTSLQFSEVQTWIDAIANVCDVCGDMWLEEYEEAVVPPRKRHSSSGKVQLTTPASGLPLPLVPDAPDLLEKRRAQLRLHSQRKANLEQLFQARALNKISGTQFYEDLGKIWKFEKNGTGNRLQYFGWERRGKASDFKAIARAFIAILNAPANRRDDTVVAELDRLAEKQEPARSAFFSEMLCLAFPEQYPVKDAPIKKYLKDIQFKYTRGAKEGGRYIELARRLRTSLATNPSYPARNLAELDTLIWGAYGR
ncbi:phospholipase D family protein [Achromobacter marplatensis]